MGPSSSPTGAWSSRPPATSTRPRITWRSRWASAASTWPPPPSLDIRAPAPWPSPRARPSGSSTTEGWSPRSCRRFGCSAGTARTPVSGPRPRGEQRAAPGSSGMDGDAKRAGDNPRPQSIRTVREPALRGGLYLAVDLIDQGLAALVLLLELAHLLELLGGETVEPLGDLIDVQALVVGGLEGAVDGGPELGLARGLFGLPENLFGLLGGLFGDPKALLGGLDALLRRLLGGPQTLPGVGGEGEELLVGPDPLATDRLQALLLLTGVANDGVRRAEVLLGLLAHGLDAAAEPVLGKVDVALLELHQTHAVGEPLLRRPDVVLLQLEEPQAVLGQLGAPTLRSREALREGLVGVPLDLSHLPGGAGHLVDVRGGSHQTCLR